MAIDPPYATSAIDPYLEAAFVDKVTAGSGGFASLFEYGAVQANQHEQLAGYVFAMGLANGVDLSPDVFKQLRKGVGQFKRRDIKGTDVWFSTGTESQYALMLVGGDAVFVFGLDADMTKGIARAIVTANR